MKRSKNRSASLIKSLKKYKPSLYLESSKFVYKQLKKTHTKAFHWKNKRTEVLQLVKKKLSIPVFSNLLNPSSETMFSMVWGLQVHKEKSFVMEIFSSACNNSNSSVELHCLSIYLNVPVLVRIRIICFQGKHKKSLDGKLETCVTK